MITDACGVKRSTVYAAQTLLREAKTPFPHAEFIAAHPMGGKESRGIENADPQIFSQANYLIVPTRENTTHGEKICLELAQTIGFRSVSLLSPEEHDETIAFVSQLPHWIAVALTTCRETETLAPYTGDSFRDLTRIAKINADLWCELFAENKDDLLRQADLFFEQFQYIRRLIAEGDYDELKRVMRLASQRRTKFDEIQDFRQKDRKTPQRIEFENAESRTNDNAPNEEKSPLGAGE